MRKQVNIVFLSSLVAFSSFAFAAPLPPTVKPEKTAAPTVETPAAQAPIQLHESPNQSSKIIGTIESGEPLMPIFTQNGWVKVANPKNGAVGWVPADELKAKGYPRLYLKTYNEKSGNKDSSGYQVIEYSGNQSVDAKQMQAVMENMQQEQIYMEKQMNQMMVDTQKNMNNLMQAEQVQPVYVPVVRPVILVPVKPAAAAGKKETEIKTSAENK